MFDRGSLARHVQNCYAYADWTSTLVEVNYVNENFCLSFTQKFATDRYVKAFRELLEQYGIACTEIEDKVHLNVPPFNLGTTMIHTL